MAAALQRIFASSTQKAPRLDPLWQAVRGAAKGNRACRQDKPQRGHSYGWKKREGDLVHEGDQLVKQRTLRFHPGLNVVFRGRQNLVAAVEGRVVVSHEKVSPRWDNARVRDFYSNRETATLHKKYYNVIPEPQGRTFKLVTQI